MMQLTSEGTFSASRFGSQRQRARRKVDRTVGATDHALQVEEFREDGIRWKVLEVDWSGKDCTAVVWYYDVRLAAHQSIMAAPKGIMDSNDKEQHRGIGAVDRSRDPRVDHEVPAGRRVQVIVSESGQYSSRSKIWAKNPKQVQVRGGLNILPNRFGFCLNT